MKIFILILFILTFAIIIALPKYKTIVTGISALIASVACAIGGFTKWYGAFLAIDYNVILMLVGIMITVGLFSESGMPNMLAEKLMSKMPNSLVALVLLSVLSGVISAFMDNVATVLMLAPIGFAVAKKIGVSPIPVLISISVSSNLQGAATLVGDTTSVMLGGFAGMGFFEFFFLDGKFSIFWAVEIGMLLTIPVIIFIFRKNNHKLNYIPEKIEISTVFPTVILLINMVVLACLSFVQNKPEISNGLVCLFFGIICFVYHLFTYKKKMVKEDGTEEFISDKTNAFKGAINTIDYSTVFFLIFLFIVIGTVESVGIINDISSFFVSIGSSNVFLLYTLIVFGSVLISAFIDNIPYVATMLPVIKGLMAGLPGVSPYLMYFGLLCGATLGGNITPVGASANVVAIGVLNKEGYNVKTSDFLKIGLPFTLVAVLGGYLFCWFVWGM